MATPTPKTSRRKSRPEAAACGIGFLASRKGVAERALVDIALGLCRQFDHRGAPGHGAGLLLDIPWPLLLDRFPEQTRVVAQRDAALGMFFLPFDAKERRLCVETVEELAAEAGSDVLGWADVPFNVEALPPGSSARRTAPVVRQALFKRPAGAGEDGWFACRYLLRLALDETLSERIGDSFAISSLSNRTVVYRGWATSTPTCATSTSPLASSCSTAGIRPTPPPPGGAPSPSGRSPTTARSPPSAATPPGCTPSAATW
jgi:glutamate synthase domain-containing protein 1